MMTPIIRTISLCAAAVLVCVFGTDTVSADHPADVAPQAADVDGIPTQSIQYRSYGSRTYSGYNSYSQGRTTYHTYNNFGYYRRPAYTYGAYRPYGFRPNYYGGYATYGGYSTFNYYRPNYYGGYLRPSYSGFYYSTPYSSFTYGTLGYPTYSTGHLHYGPGPAVQHYYAAPLPFGHYGY